MHNNPYYQYNPGGDPMGEDIMMHDDPAMMGHTAMPPFMDDMDDDVEFIDDFDGMMGHQMMPMGGMHPGMMQPGPMMDPATMPGMPMQGHPMMDEEEMHPDEAMMQEEPHPMDEVHPDEMMPEDGHPAEMMGAEMDEASCENCGHPQFMPMEDDHMMFDDEELFFDVPEMHGPMPAMHPAMAGGPGPMPGMHPGVPEEDHPMDGLVVDEHDAVVPDEMMDDMPSHQAPYHGSLHGQEVKTKKFKR